MKKLITALLILFTLSCSTPTEITYSNLSDYTNKYSNPDKAIKKAIQLNSLRHIILIDTNVLVSCPIFKVEQKQINFVEFKSDGKHYLTCKNK